MVNHIRVFEEMAVFRGVPAVSLPPDRNERCQTARGRGVEKVTKDDEN